MCCNLNFYVRASVWLCFTHFLRNGPFWGRYDSYWEDSLMMAPWCPETCRRFANVWWTYFVRVKLVVQINLGVMLSSAYSHVFWLQCLPDYQLSWVSRGIVQSVGVVYLKGPWSPPTNCTPTCHPHTVELGYNAVKQTEYFVSL